MRLAALFLFGSMLAIAASENVRGFPDVEIKTPVGTIRATTLSVKKGSRTRLTGALLNTTDKNWDHVTIQIQPSDGRGTVFRPSPLHLFGMTAGSSKPFYFDLTGKFDFATVSYSMTFQDGTYAARYQFEMLGPTPNERLQFSDELTEWTFLPGEKSIELQLVNKSEKSAKLDWNQAAYVDASGKAHKVAGSGTRYIEVNSTKPPTMIPPGANIRDAIVPTDHVSYSSGWNVESIFPKCPSCRNLAGTEFRVFIPLEIGGVQREYSFRFKVKSVE